MNEKITKLLGEELSKQVEAKLGTVELAIMNDGTVVPAEKHDGLKAELKLLKSKYDEDLGDITKKLEDATKGATDIDALKTDLQKLADEKADLQKTYQKELQNTKIESAIDVALIGENVPEKYVKVLKTQINKDSLSIEDGKVIGLTDIIGNLKGSYGEMFGEVKRMGTPPADGTKHTPPMGERAKLEGAYENAKTIAEKLSIQRKIKSLKE